MIKHQEMRVRNLATDAIESNEARGAALLDAIRAEVPASDLAYVIPPVVRALERRDEAALAAALDDASCDPDFAWLETHSGRRFRLRTPGPVDRWRWPTADLVLMEILYPVDEEWDPWPTPRRMPLAVEGGGEIDGLLGIKDSDAELRRLWAIIERGDCAEISGGTITLVQAGMVG